MKRLIFYGVLFAITYFGISKLSLAVTGELGFKVFVAFSIVSGTIQSVNFLVIKQISELGKLSDIGFWAKIRLKNRAISRRSVAFQRAFVGLSFSLATGGLSAYMNALGHAQVPTFILSLSIFTALISMIMLFLTLYEYYVVSVFETELSERAEKNAAKKDALRSIRDE